MWAGFMEFVDEQQYVFQQKLISIWAGFVKSEDEQHPFVW
jgi:hypothetical protein